MVLVKINKISTLLMGNTLGKSTDHLDLWPLKTIIVREKPFCLQAKGYDYLKHFLCIPIALRRLCKHMSEVTRVLRVFHDTSDRLTTIPTLLTRATLETQTDDLCPFKNSNVEKA